MKVRLLLCKEDGDTLPTDTLVLSFSGETLKIGSVSPGVPPEFARTSRIRSAALNVKLTDIWRTHTKGRSDVPVALRLGAIHPCAGP